MSVEPTGRTDAGDDGVGVGWSRSAPVRALRELVQLVALGPVLRSEVEVESRGSEEIAELAAELAEQPAERADQPAERARPMIIVANHASHLDTPVLLSTLPPEVRRRTVVAAVGGALFDSGWRRRASALIFNAVLLDTSSSPADARTGSGVMSATVPSGRVRADDLLAAGWNLLIYPEGGRSADGFLGRFADLAARLAIATRCRWCRRGCGGRTR